MLKPIQTYQPKLLTIAKFTLVMTILCLIVYKLFFTYDIYQISESFVFKWSYKKLELLLLVLLLLVANVLIESRKWRLILYKHENVTYIQSVKSVLAGITLGIITPSHLGDFAGKALFLQSYDKIKGAIVTSIGGIAQTLASLMFGSIGIWCLAWTQGYFSEVVLYSGLVLITVLLGFIYIAFINIQWLKNRIKWKKIQEYIDAFTHYSQSELSGILLLSLFRFCVFNAQYFLLLLFFGVDISILNASLALTTIFLVQSFVPSFVLIEFGLRGASALYFIGMFSNNTTGILLAAYSLWIINLMIPGLFGLYFLLKLKWRSSQ